MEIINIEDLFFHFHKRLHPLRENLFTAQLVLRHSEFKTYPIKTFLPFPSQK